MTIGFFFKPPRHTPTPIQEIAGEKLQGVLDISKAHRFEVSLRIGFEEQAEASGKKRR